jgi:hypothetical protein
MAGELVDIVGDAPPRFVLAQLVRQLDFDGAFHDCDCGRAGSAFQASAIGYSAHMRFLLALFALVAASAVRAQAPVVVPQPADPAAAYVTAGQDEPGYRAWIMAAPLRSSLVAGFNHYLVDNRVAGIVPTWQLLRTASSWRNCGAQPFEVPPPEEWPHLVQTLRYINDYVIPTVGPVEPVSGYRNPSLNVCAGGAPESAHKTYSAIDVVPLRPMTREAMMRSLCVVHTAHGAPYHAGLGFYAYMRFHVDSTKFRRWNMDPTVAAECPPILHKGDDASVGQPIAPAQTAAAPLMPVPPAAAQTTRQ